MWMRSYGTSRLLWLENNSTDFEEETRIQEQVVLTSLSLHDFGLWTEIGNSSRDYSGRIIDYQNVELMNRSRRWHSRLRVNSSKRKTIKCSFKD